MSGPQPQAIALSPAQQALLESLLRQTTCPQAMALRMRIVLAAAADQRNETLARTLGCSLPTVRKWRCRWAHAQAALAAAEAHPPELRALVATVLADAPRSGSPGRFSAEQIVEIINLACTPPPTANRPVNAWTAGELADEAVTRGIVQAISARSVGRFLKRGSTPATSEPLLA